MANIENSEIKKFEKMASEWWDEEGKFKPLHQMNPVRIEFVRDSILRNFNLSIGKDCLKNIEILDVGCGGGLLAEPLTRLGAKVKGIDASVINIEVAKLHAENSGLSIEYSSENLEDLPEDELYDAVVSLEVIEHTIDPEKFVIDLCTRVKPGGIVIVSTINRNIKSYAIAIMGAEYILRWLPVGTHDWKKFMKPSEVNELFEKQSFYVEKMSGMRYDILNRSWSLSDSDLSVNYAMCFKKTF